MYPIDLAWAAGFFDADGHFGRKATPVAASSQTSVESLDIFAHVVGLENARIHGPYDRSTASIKRNPQWVFQVYGKRARAVFDAIEPWLGTYRRDQGQRAAWAAGFFDGEGSFDWGDTPRVQITNSDFELLGRFRHAVGVGNVYGPYKPSPSSPAKKPRYAYQAWSFEIFQAVLAILWPNLGSRKRDQALAIQREYLTVRRCGHLRTGSWTKYCPQCFKPGPKPGFKKKRVTPT